MAESNWYWQHPYPTGCTVNCVQFIDNNNGWIATGWSSNNYGELYGTADGGSTWTRLCETSDALHRVFFLNTSEGWACGEDGILLHTTDGGSNWSYTYPGGTSTDLFSIEFVDSSYGTLVGASGKIYRTMNGGSSWSLQGSGIANSIYDVSFVSPTTGWATGAPGWVLNTVTAGAFWQGQYTGVPAKGIHFLDESRGFAAGGSYIAGTDDGGISWSGVCQVGGADFTDIDFNGNLGAASGMLGVAVTENEAISWEYEFMPEHPLWPTEPSLQSVSVPSDSRVIAAGEYGIIYSRDSSGDWNQLSTNETNVTINSITHFDAYHTWACGENGVIMRSSNGGQSWSSQAVNTDCSLRDICFPTALTGYCVGYSSSEGVILKTVDSGSNWIDITPVTPSVTDLQSVDFMNENCGVAVGLTGDIVYTTDGGTTWAEKTGFGSTALNRVRFSDTDRGWAVGAGGKIICFDFSSDSWSQQTSAMNGAFYGLFPLNSDTVWAVGQSGTIARTQNAGGWWQILSTTGGTFGDVWFAENGLDGYLSGLNGGYFSVTSNGGWTVSHSAAGSPENLLSDISFIDVNNGWGCGSYGTILRYGDETTGIANFNHAVEIDAGARITASPNPFTTSASVSFDLPGACNAVLCLYDLTGREVQTLHSGSLSRGEHSFTVDGADLAPGIYFLRLTAGGVTETRSVIRIP